VLIVASTVAKHAISGAKSTQNYTTLQHSAHVFVGEIKIIITLFFSCVLACSIVRVHVSAYLQLLLCSLF